MRWSTSNVDAIAALVSDWSNEKVGKTMGNRRITATILEYTPPHLSRGKQKGVEFSRKMPYPVLTEE
jgi:hypothetical protein